MQTTELVAVHLKEPLGEMGYQFHLQVGGADGIRAMSIENGCVFVEFHGTAQASFGIPLANCKIVWPRYTHDAGA